MRTCLFALAAALSVALPWLFGNRHGLRNVVHAFVRDVLTSRDQDPSPAFDALIADGRISDGLFAASVVFTFVGTLLPLVALVRRLRGSLSAWAFTTRIASFFVAFALVCAAMGLSLVTKHSPFALAAEQSFVLGKLISALDVTTYAYLAIFTLTMAHAELFAMRPSGAPKLFEPRALAISVIVLVLMIALRAASGHVTRTHALGPLVVCGLVVGVGRFRRMAPAVLTAVFACDAASGAASLARTFRLVLLENGGRLLTPEHLAWFMSAERWSFAIGVVDIALVYVLLHVLHEEPRPRAIFDSPTVWTGVVAVGFGVLVASHHVSLPYTRLDEFATTRAPTVALATPRPNARLLIVRHAGTGSGGEGLATDIVVEPTATWRDVDRIGLPPRFGWIMSDPDAVELDRLSTMSGLLGVRQRAAIVRYASHLDAAWRAAHATDVDEWTMSTLDEDPPVPERPFAGVVLVLRDTDGVNAIAGRIAALSAVMHGRDGTTAAQPPPILLTGDRDGARALVRAKPAKPAARVVRPSPGCARAAAGDGQPKTQELDVKGTKRTYAIVVPREHGKDRPAALIVALHGGGGDAEEMHRDFAIDRAAGQDAVVVYPNGRSHVWDIQTEGAKNQDDAFVTELLFFVKDAYCIDTSRVFLAGYSMGGYFVDEYTCRHGRDVRATAIFAAGGPHGSAVELDEDSAVACDGLVPGIVVHGRKDDNVDPQEGVFAREHTRRQNRCGPKTTPATPESCVDYGPCALPSATAPAGATRYCDVPGLGHFVWEKGADAVWGFWSSLP
jgi:polyhydroxybutyrate depolymerase